MGLLDDDNGQHVVLGIGYIQHQKGIVLSVEQPDTYISLTQARGLVAQLQLVIEACENLPPEEEVREKLKASGGKAERMETIEIPFEGPEKAN